MGLDCGRTGQHYVQGRVRPRGRVLLQDPDTEDEEAGRGRQELLLHQRARQDCDLVRQSDLQEEEGLLQDQDQAHYVHIF